MAASFMMRSKIAETVPCRRGTVVALSVSCSESFRCLQRESPNRSIPCRESVDGDPTMTAIRRILCPLDFSRFSRHALEQAVALAREFGAEISALHVFTLAPVMEVVPPAGR